MCKIASIKRDTRGSPGLLLATPGNAPKRESSRKERGQEMIWGDSED